jgi:uncharacterized protein
MAGKLGVHPQQPENAALERELRCLYGTRAEIFVHWSRQAPPDHTGRMPQLEQEDASRFPTRPGPTACQPVKGSQAGAGQLLGREPETRTIEVMAMPTEPRVADNPRASRYELWLGTTRAGLIEYQSEPGMVFLVHTEVDPAFEGQGLGERLVAGALEDIRARGLKLVPLCPFVRAYLRRHPDQADLVAGDPAVPQ